MAIANSEQTATKPNASTIRTRKRIREAFLKLAETTDFYAINVNMLTKAAGLNRTTFYLHYQTMNALIDEIVDQIVTELGEGGRLLAAGIGKDQPGLHDSYFHTIGERPELYHRVFSSPGSSPLSARVMDMHVTNIRAIWTSYGFDLAENEDAWNLRARYAAGGVYSATIHWLECGMVESAESVCDRVFELVMLTAKAEQSN